MAKLKRRPVKKPAPKRARKKGIGKGAKALALFFGLALAAIVVWLVSSSISNAVSAARTVPVDVDAEWGGEGDAPGQFKEPECIAVDSAGNLYVSEFSGHRVQKFDPTGHALLAIGHKGDGDGEFNQPSGIYVAPDGSIYVCDTFGKAQDSIGRIQKFDAQGKFLKAWSHNFFGPRSIAGDGQNRLYVSDTGNHKIQVFDRDGNFLTQWGGMGTTEGKFREPDGLTLDPQGNVFVADSDNLRIQKFDPNGKFLGSFKVSTWEGKNKELPYLAFSQGFLYASNASQNAVLKYDPNGKLISIYKRKGDKAGFQRAAGVALDGQFHLFVVEWGNYKVARFTPPVMPLK